MPYSTGHLLMTGSTLTISLYPDLTKRYILMTAPILEISDPIELRSLLWKAYHKRLQWATEG